MIDPTTLQDCPVCNGIGCFECDFDGQVSLRTYRSLMDSLKPDYNVDDNERTIQDAIKRNREES